MEITEQYVLLSKHHIKEFPIKKSLGHKLIGVEPDLIIDMTLHRPRIMIRHDLFNKNVIQGVVEQDAGYFVSNNKKLFLGFSYITPQKSIKCKKVDSNSSTLTLECLDKDELISAYQGNISILKITERPDVIAINKDLIHYFQNDVFRDVEFRGNV